ncbi:MAG: hypothetical protein JTT11_07555 [Candidatus Brockarchaeota archaeon]|nr:hypothetical protein [Candidatus Brockarchaeota archaeon]
MFVSLYFMVLGILLVVSAGMLAIGVRELASSSDPSQSMFYVLIGTSGLAITLYSIWQIQSKTKGLKIQVAKVVTVLECGSCHKKVTRNFKEGDYVYGTGEKCGSCGSDAPMTITDVFAEKPPQKKTTL